MKPLARFPAPSVSYLPFSVSGNIREEDIMILPLDSIAFSTHSDAVQQVLKQFGRVLIIK